MDTLFICCKLFTLLQIECRERLFVQDVSLEKNSNNLSPFHIPHLNYVLRNGLCLELLWVPIGPWGGVRGVGPSLSMYFKS